MKKRRRHTILFHIFEANWRHFTLLPFVAIISFLGGVLIHELTPFHLLLQNQPYEKWQLFASNEITCCFTPTQRCLPLILQNLFQAKKSIYVQAYTFTSRPIADALIQAHLRGVKVIVIADKSQMRSSHSQVRTLSNQGIPIYFDTQPSIAHNKVMIIDGSVLLSGSYNFSNAAEYRNAENILVISNREIAQKYSNNFQKRLSISIKKPKD